MKEWRGKAEPVITWRSQKSKKSKKQLLRRAGADPPDLPLGTSGGGD